LKAGVIVEPVRGEPVRGNPAKYQDKEDATIDEEKD